MLGSTLRLLLWQRRQHPQASLVIDASDQEIANAIKMPPAAS